MECERNESPILIEDSLSLLCLNVNMDPDPRGTAKSTQPGG